MPPPTPRASGNVLTFEGPVLHTAQRWLPAACTDHEKAHPDKSEAKGFLADPARATLAAGVRRTLTTCIQALGTLGERAVAAQDGAMVAELADVLLPFTAEPEPGSEMETCKSHAELFLRVLLALSLTQRAGCRRLERPGAPRHPPRAIRVLGAGGSGPRAHHTNPVEMLSLSLSLTKLN